MDTLVNGLLALFEALERKKHRNTSKTNKQQQQNKERTGSQTITKNTSKLSLNLIQKVLNYGNFVFRGGPMKRRLSFAVNQSYSTYG